MAKKNFFEKHYEFLFYIAVTIVVIILLSTLPEGNFLASVSTLDTSGNEVNADILLEPKLNTFTQSIFGLNPNSEAISLMSTVPSTEENPTSVFRAAARNPFDNTAFLSHVTALRNDVQIYKEKINQYIKPKDEYIYTSQIIETTGRDATLNDIKLVFEFEKDEQIKTQSFEFQYYVLKPCTKNVQCQVPVNYCDIGNLGGFSNDADKSYCTMACLSNSQCYSGQICKKGVCGY